MSARVASGTEAQEYIRQTYNEEESKFKMEGCTEIIKKASDYKTCMNNQWKNERRTNDRDRQTIDHRSLPNIDQCQGCGAQKDKMHTREMCPATDKDCYNCGTRGHFTRICRKPPRNQTRHVQKMVRVAESHSGGADPTPMMKNVKVFPRDGGRPFTFEMCPDTGCTMTLISKDVVACQGMTVDTRSRKRVRAVNGQKLDNSWTVSFGIEYQGRTIEVEALFSSSIEGEVLLSWQILKKLGVINSSFPNIQVRAAVASTIQHPGDIRQEREARVKLTKLIREFDQVFYEDGPLRTMKGDPMKIHIKTVVKIIPLNVCTPRKTPIAYTQAAKIDSDLKLGIIEKVDGVSD